MSTPRCFYGCDPELERIELGPRVAYCDDETQEIAYRIGEAMGLPRVWVPLAWQWVFAKVGRSTAQHWSHSDR